MWHRRDAEGDVANVGGDELASEREGELAWRVVGVQVAMHEEEVVAGEVLVR